LTKSDKNVDLNDWVSERVQRIAFDFNESDVPSLLNKLEWFTDNSTLENLESKPHVYEEAWLCQFRMIVRAFENVSAIPDASVLITVLRMTKERLALLISLEEKLLELRTKRSVISLRSTLVKLIEHLIAKLGSSQDITFKIHHCCRLEKRDILVCLHLKNSGSTPIRNLQVTLEPTKSTAQVDIHFLAQGESQEIELRGSDLRESESDSFCLIWTGHNLEYEKFEGKREICANKFDTFDSNETPTEIGDSPYVCGDPVKTDRRDMFFGRSVELDQIHRLIATSGNSVLLEGNRRAGKSSILYQLEGLDGVPGWLGVYCSLQGADGAKEGGIPTATVFRHVTYEVAQSIRKLTGSVTLPDGSVLDSQHRLGISRALQNVISNESPSHDFRVCLELFVEELRAKNLSLLLMLDEFDKLQEGIESKVTLPEVLENFRYLLQSIPGFCAILTGSRRMQQMREEHWSALYGLGTRIGVTAISESAASSLITEPVKGRLKFTKESIEMAKHLTACQPYLLQCLCNRVFDIAAQTGDRLITTDHVSRASKAFVEDNEHFAALWDYAANERRRFILMLLNTADRNSVPMRFNAIQSRLYEHGLRIRQETLIRDIETLRELEVVELKEGAAYALAIPMMGQWLDGHKDFEIALNLAKESTDDLETPKSAKSGILPEIEGAEQRVHSQVAKYEEEVRAAARNNRLAEHLSKAPKEPNFEDQFSYDHEAYIQEQFALMEPGPEDFFDAQHEAYLREQEALMEPNYEDFIEAQYEASLEGSTGLDDEEQEDRPYQKTAEEEEEEFLEQFDDDEEAEYYLKLCDRELMEEELLDGGERVQGDEEDFPDQY
jgi:type I restriction enzyme M protein